MMFKYTACLSCCYRTKEGIIAPPFGLHVCLEVHLLM